MGEQEDKIYTDEELVILGEKEPDPEPKEPEAPPPAKEGEEEKPPEEGKTEPEVSDEEKEAAEAQGYQIVTEKGKTYFVDDEGSKIPAKRFRSVYREGQENKRRAEENEHKFNLFKELGAEEYYNRYPDEKPAGFKPAEKAPVEREEEDLGRREIIGGPYAGKTLSEVWEIDPRAAHQIEEDYKDKKRQEKAEEERRQNELLEQSQQEVNVFYDQLAKETFGKEATALSEQEGRKVTARAQSVFDWMAKTGRAHYNPADAYFVMNQEKILADAKARGGREALESLNKPGIPSVNTSGGSSIPSSNLEEMSRDQLSAEMQKWDEKKYQKFMKEASKALRDKHPDLPWL